MIEGLMRGPARGRRLARSAAVAAVLASLVGLGLVAGPATAAPASERADTLAQARDDAAIKVSQVIKERLHAASDKDWFRYVITKRTRAVVTLGALPANYNLAVYRADGSRIAISDHAGKGFERIYFTATPGTYYVRVAATKGFSQAKYRLWLRSLTGTLALQSFTVAKINSGYPWVVAEFVNTTNKWQRVDFVAVNSIAKDGTTVKQDGVNLQQWRVAPYGLLHVASSTLFPLPAVYDHLQLKATAKPLDAVSVSALKRTSGPVVTRDGYKVHTGTVKNTGTTTRGGNDDPNGPSVDVAYYNANGTILGTGLTNLLDEIAPGRTVKYEVMARQSSYWYSPFPTPNRYTTQLIAAW